MTVATKIPDFAAAFLETSDIKLTKKDFKNCKKVCLGLSEMLHSKTVMLFLDETQNYGD